MDSSIRDAEQGRWLEQLIFSRLSRSAGDGIFLLMDYWNRHVDRGR